MKRLLLLSLIVCAIAFGSSNASAGSNGDAPQNGQNWIINQDTHVWDEVVSVKDITVNYGKTLKLENVSLSSKGFIEIRGETRWINSTVYHEQDADGDNISLYSTLTIINSDLTLNTIKKNSELTANCLDLRSGSNLIITDYDMNPETTDDQSNIKSDVSGKGNYTEKLDYTVQLGRIVGGTGVPNTKVTIENSNFEYIKAIRFTGTGSYIRNSSFDLVSRINVNVDGFIFTNNTFSNGFYGSDLFLTDVDNALIQDNIFANGSHGVQIRYGNYNTIRDNIFRDYDYKNEGQGVENIILF